MEYTTGRSLNITKKQGATKKPTCAFCEGEHFSDACERYKTADDRKEALKNGCYKCLGTGHRIGECKRTKPCFHCQRNDHHSSLCFKKFGRNPPPKTSSADTKPPAKKDTASVTLSSGVSPKSHAVLKMARVEFPDHDESARAYCDDGSSASYITSDKASKVDLNMSEYKYVSVGRFGSTKRENQRYRSAALPLPLRDGSVFQLPVYVVDNITSTVQKLPLNAAKYLALNVLPLADDIVDKPEIVKIGILIGGDYLHQLLTGYVLSATIKHHLALENTQVATQIDGETYVDNIQGGAEDLPSALTFYKEVKEIFRKIGMNAREWYSNCSGFISKIAPKDIGISDSPKVLGLPWNTTTDVIHSVSPKVISQCRTKREILSALSTAYDPLGYVCLVVMNAKLVVQDLWTSNYSWDEPVSDSIADRFEKIQSDMAQISDLVLPRKINSLIAEKEAEHELHCFADASGKAYTAVVYIRSSLPSGKVSVGLAFANCRLAPMVKAITIARLELMAAKIGVRLLSYVQHEMAAKVAFTSRHLWVDSKCVLYWINSKKKLKTFVHNRVSEIRKSTDVQIRYVPTACNPADIPSRGMPAAELIDNKLWWEGPSFLTLPKSMWPEQESSTSLLPKESTVDIETQSDTALPSTLEDVPTLIDLSRFSKWRKLVRVTSWVLIAISKFKGVDSDDIFTPSVQHQAELYWIRVAQKSHEGQSQVSLATKGLVLYEDDQGIIRCKGRLEHAKMSPETKAPVFLPRNHPITQLIIQYCHEVLGHAGVRHTLIQLRRQFWVCQGKRQVSKIIKVCQLCRKVTGAAYKAPPFPPIHDFRVTPSLPFQNLGVDYFGPLLVDHENGPKKVWVALFTCCVTRAVHLDLVNALSADQFVLYLPRLISLYGRPTLIISDNAKQFKATNQLLSSAAKEWAEDQKIHWKFLTEKSPWMGGFYERLVGTVKSSLRKTLLKKQLSADQLLTVLFEAAAIVSSRPLVSTGDPEHDPGQIALTPAHSLFKFGRSGLPPIDTTPTLEDLKSTSQSLLESWKTGQRILNEYWVCWRNEYLASLRENTAIGFKQRNCSPFTPTGGSVVQIKDETSRCN